MNDAHCRNGELHRTGLNRHKGGVSSQAGGDQLYPPNRNHAVGGAGRLLRMQGEVTEQAGVGLRFRCLRHTLWRERNRTLRSVGGCLGAPVYWWAWFSSGPGRRSRGVLQIQRTRVRRVWCCSRAGQLCTTESALTPRWGSSCLVHVYNPVLIWATIQPRPSGSGVRVRVVVTMSCTGQKSSCENTFIYPHETFCPE